MPELPEVETMVRGVRPAIERAVLVECQRTACHCRPIVIQPSLAAIRRRVLGKRCSQVSRLGKRILLRFETGDCFVIEPRMTGLLLTAAPPDVEHLRFSWTWEHPASIKPRRQTVLFWDRRGLGQIRLVTTNELEKLQQTLGPDPLKMSVTDWRSVVAQTSRPIKVALLDQALVAGIGNLYASEILHLAKISPVRPANSLSAEQLARLSSAVLKILNTAIQYEGSTLGDGTYRNALNQTGSYQNQHTVYDRAGEMCPDCRRDQIVRIVQAQRSTFYCLRCQK